LWSTIDQRDLEDSRPPGGIPGTEQKWHVAAEVE
jgi:hypothetical protein